MNICGSVAQCGTDPAKPMAGCEMENGKAVGAVGVETTLQLSTDGVLTLTYKGVLDTPTGRGCAPLCGRLTGKDYQNSACWEMKS